MVSLETENTYLLGTITMVSLETKNTHFFGAITMVSLETKNTHFFGAITMVILETENTHFFGAITMVRLETENTHVVPLIMFFGSLFVICLFSFSHYIVCSSIYCFLLPVFYLQTFLTCIYLDTSEKSEHSF
jgi:hypothetical protein